MITYFGKPLDELPRETLIKAVEDLYERWLRAEQRHVGTLNLWSSCLSRQHKERRYTHGR